MTLKKTLLLSAILALAAQRLPAQTIIGAAINNGNMDQTVVITPPGLPKPTVWQYDGSRTLDGAFADALSSEPWAGPAPTPDTNPGDFGVFFKAFQGNLTTQNLVTGRLSQTHTATPGLIYTLTGWAGAEENYSGLSLVNAITRTEMAIEFLDASSAVVGNSVLDLKTAGLGQGVGVAFGYQQFSLTATAPAGAASVRASVAMIDGYNTSLPRQAFVVDDFTLTAIPEPTGLLAIALGIACLGVRRR